MEEFILFMECYLAKHYSIPWDDVSKHPMLSEAFIRQFKDDLNWAYITEFQPQLSEEFLWEFQDNVVWEILNYEYHHGHRQFSPEFIEYFKDKFKI